MAILNTRQVTAQEAGFLLDISLRQSLLQAVGANRGADLHG
jgi:hypothetical protein